MRYEIRHALVQYGAETVLEDVNFEIHDHEKVAVVGRNGCGKTTLLKLIAGDLTMNNPDSDEACGITRAGVSEIGYLRQISFEDAELTVEEEIKKVFAPVFACERQMHEIEEALSDGTDHRLLARYHDLQKQMEALQGYTWRQDMELMLRQFGFSPEDLQRPVGSFSGGQQTKLAFIKLFLSRPDIMLLDEPTNHLDLPTIEWLESFLKRYDKAVVIVSHDRMFLDRVADVTYEIEYHRIRRYVGNYTAFMRQKEENLAKQEKDYEAQQKEIRRLTEWIEKWKNTPTKVSATLSKRKAIEHMVKIEKPRRFDTASFKAMFTPRVESYSEVLSARQLGIGYGSELARVSLRLMRGERLAIIGENGKGKSTLLKTLTGLIPPLAGSFSFGQRVEWGYFDQQEAVVNDADPQQTVLENFWEEYPDCVREQVRGALGAFLFSGEEVEKQMGQLSGGEKVRLELCKMFYTRPNLLILDEPTNHMDIIGKDALEKMLRGFGGTVLFVSHDRYFINQVATGILEFESAGPDGVACVRQYQGGYEAYLAEKQKRQAGLITDIGRESAAAPGSASNQGGTGSRQTAGGFARSSADAGPTLKDVFDQKTYYNPGKIRSRLQRQLEKYGQQLQESEKKAEELSMQLMDPALASDYQKLMELQSQLDEEEHQQETLLERMVEAEMELEELEEKEQQRQK